MGFIWNRIYISKTVDAVMWFYLRMLKLLIKMDKIILKYPRRRVFVSTARTLNTKKTSTKECGVAVMVKRNEKNRNFSLLIFSFINITWSTAELFFILWTEFSERFVIYLSWEMDKVWCGIVDRRNRNFINNWVKPHRIVRILCDKQNFLLHYTVVCPRNLDFF